MICFGVSERSLESTSTADVLHFLFHYHIHISLTFHQMSSMFKIAPEIQITIKLKVHNHK